MIDRVDFADFDLDKVIENGKPVIITGFDLGPVKGFSFKNIKKV